jgi:hypothetical protein
MSMTYSELVTAIETYTENTFPATTLADNTVVSSTTQINRFIEQAEQRIFNTIQFPSLRKNVTGALAYNNKYLNSPDDFLSVYSLAVIDSTGTYTYLLNKDVNFIREAYPDPTSLGQPKYYAIFGPQSGNANELTFILGPTPDASYQAELHYYYYPPSITVSSDGHSWLGDNLDTVLLYGSLMEAYTYMKGEQDLIALYTARYQEALAEAKRLGDGLERQDAYRSGQYRQAVT